MPRATDAPLDACRPNGASQRFRRRAGLEFKRRPGVKPGKLRVDRPPWTWARGRLRRLACPSVERFAGIATLGHRGGVAEWSKAHAWSACMRETVSRVRIPLPPPIPGRKALTSKTSASGTRNKSTAARTHADQAVRSLVGSRLRSSSGPSNDLNLTNRSGLARGVRQDGPYCVGERLGPSATC